MPKELKDITNNVMGKIHQGQIKMRPRIFFIIGSIFTFIGLVLSILTSVFFIAFVRFTLRSRGPMGQYRLEELFSIFSWWGPVLGVLGLIFGIYLLHRYDFSYKNNFKFIAIGFILAVVVAGWIFDMTGLHDIWLQRGPMKGVMRQYFQGKNIQTNLNLISIKGN